MFPFYMMLTEFCENLKVVSSHFSMMKKTVAPLSSLGLPVKLICCFKSGFSDWIYSLKSISISE